METQPAHLADLHGVVPPMLTPFDTRDRIDRVRLASEAKHLIRCGVNGMVVGGSMGEGAGLSAEELSTAVRIVIEAVEGSVPVLAGVIADDSREAIRLATAARDAGAVALQAPPPHFQFVMDQGVLATYYRAITESTGLPLLIYNVVPWAQVAVESLQELIAANPLIVAVKQSGRNIHTLALLLSTLKGKVRIFTALDDMIYPSLALGADGTISGTSSVFPGETVELYNAVRADQHNQALTLHERLTPVWRMVDTPDFPSRAKYVATLAGRDVGEPRRPFRFPTGEVAAQIRDVLARNGFLAEVD